jgi:hypothetical protein
MVDSLHIPVRNRTKKPPAFVLSGVMERGLKGIDNGGNVTNVH